MKRILISAPSGYNTREILLPLKEHLEALADLEHVFVVTPAAALRDELWSEFGDLFSFHLNPGTLEEHTSLIKELSPNLVLTPTVGLDRFDVPIIRAAKLLGIPTLTFIASWDNVFKMARLQRYANDFELPDYFAVWNQMNYDHVLQLFPDIEPKRIQIVGAPRFDYFSHSDRIPSREKLLEYLGIPVSAAALIHGATTELYPFDYIMDALHQGTTRDHLHQKVSLYASVHPGGNLEHHQHYQQWGVTVRYSFGRRETSPVPQFRYLPTTPEIYMLIALFKYTAVLVNQSSTVAIESMLADVPVINVMFGRPFDWWHWYRSMVYRDFHQHYRYITDEGGTSLVRRRGQFIAAVNECLDNPSYRASERRQTAQKLLTYTNGSASGRLLRYCQQIAA